jgi:hypothetical protein
MNAWSLIRDEITRSFPDHKRSAEERWGGFEDEFRQRGQRLVGQARQDATELAALAARHVLELAGEFGLPLAAGRRRRTRRRSMAWLVAAVALVAVSAAALTLRD